MSFDFEDVSLSDLELELRLNCFSRFLPHCFRLLKWLFFAVSGESLLLERRMSLLRLLQTTSLVVASGCIKADEEASLAKQAISQQGGVGADAYVNICSSGKVMGITRR